MSFNFAPRLWAQCNGQLLSVQQNQALFSILGISFGGDGQSTFGVPDLRGASPLGYGLAYLLGAKGGEATHQLTSPEMPPHTHSVNCLNTPGSISQPQGAVFAGTKAVGGLPFDKFYSPTASTTMAGPTITSVGNNIPHQNMQPYQVLVFCISLSGVYPSRG